MKLHPFDGNDFAYNVYDVVRQIPQGKVMTYKQIAELLGMPMHARHIGHALKLMPPHLDIPAHRVVNAAGKLAPCWSNQPELLTNEGVKLKPNGCVDLKKFQWKLENEF